MPHLLPRDATLARYMLWSCVLRLSVRLSVRVRPSVTSRCFSKTAKRRITKTTPHVSQGLLFSEAKDRLKIRPGSPPTGALNAGGVR